MVQEISKFAEKRVAKIGICRYHKATFLVHLCEKVYGKVVWCNHLSNGVADLATYI